MSKTSSRHIFKTSSRCLQDMFWRSLQDVFKRYLQDVFKTSWKTKNCYAEDVLKTSSRHVLKTPSRRLQDQQMFAGQLQTTWQCFCNNYWKRKWIELVLWIIMTNKHGRIDSILDYKRVSEITKQHYFPIHQYKTQSSWSTNMRNINCWAEKQETMVEWSWLATTRNGEMTSIEQYRCQPRMWKSW